MATDNSAKKAIYGLLGKDIDYSFSRSYFTEKFKREQRTDAVYINFDLQDLTELHEVLKTQNLSGMNVTIPYKEKVFPFLSTLDPVAEKIGAVNTIALTPQGLKGYNTDAYGFEQSLLPHLHSTRGKALVLGSGGASKAVCYILKQLGFKLDRVSRDREKTGMNYQDLEEKGLGGYQVVVNTTPLGTFPDVEAKPSIPYSTISSNCLGFDLIYNPDKTAFLKAFEQAGASIQNGLAMLEFQAEKAWEIWQQHRIS